MVEIQERLGTDVEIIFYSGELAAEMTGLQKEHFDAHGRNNSRKVERTIVRVNG